MKTPVLVTGAGGFIGSHVVEALLERGFRVRALVHYNGAGRRGHLTVDSPRLEVVAGDVTDGPQTREFVKGCGGVLHLAALIGIPYSYHAAASYVATNVQGTLNVLEACRQHRVGRVVVTSTSEVYGTAQTTPMEESHPLNAQSPYAATKVAADQLALAYARSHGLPVVVLRPFNTYGPRQSARAVVPTVLSQMLGGGPVRLGNLEARRDLTFVTDTADAFLRALTAPGVEGETLHVGQGTAVSVRQLVEICARVLRKTPRVLPDPRRRRPAASEVDLLLCNPAKARRLLGWAPRVGLEEGLRRTARYLRKHRADYPADRYGV